MLPYNKQKYHQVSIEDFDQTLPMIQMIGEGSVGPEFSTMFTMFINNRLDKMVTPKDILLHDNEAYIIGELRNTVGRGNDYRADIASIMATRLINYSITYSEKNSITKIITDRLVRLVTDKETFANDLKYHIVKKLLNGNKRAFQPLTANPDVMVMATK